MRADDIMQTRSIPSTKGTQERTAAVAARYAVLLACLLSPVCSAAPPSVHLPVPSDLRQEALLVQQKGRPLVVLMVIPDCPYCEEVRVNYLMPLVRDSAPAERPIIREIDVTSNTPMRGYAGEALTQRAFAERYKVRMTPTVLMLDKAGNLLAPPLVGSGMAGFYGTYLDRAFAQADQALQRAGASQGQAK